MKTTTLQILRTLIFQKLLRKTKISNEILFTYFSLPISAWNVHVVSKFFFLSLKNFAITINRLHESMFDAQVELWEIEQMKRIQFLMYFQSKMYWNVCENIKLFWKISTSPFSLFFFFGNYIFFSDFQVILYWFEMRLPRCFQLFQLEMLTF